MLDMEWNQPPVKERTISEPVVLHGEIIRIGAVMLDEELKETDRLYICVIPKFYKKMNAAVGRVTGLKSRSITYGMGFKKAYHNFIGWCGNDCVILTWGGEDSKIMKANLAVHGIKANRLPKFYDLQQIYAHRIVCDGRQHSLSAALEHYGLPSELKAHNALNDAVYTARIGVCMDFPRYLPEYEQMLRTAERIKREKYVTVYRDYEGMEHAVNRSDISTCICPICGKEMKREKYIFHRDNIAVSCAACKEHGDFYVRIRFRLCSDGSLSVTKRFKRLTADYRAFYERRAEEMTETGSLR